MQQLIALGLVAAGAFLLTKLSKKGEKDYDDKSNIGDDSRDSRVKSQSSARPDRTRSIVEKHFHYYGIPSKKQPMDAEQSERETNHEPVNFNDKKQSNQNPDQSGDHSGREPDPT